MDDSIFHNPFPGKFPDKDPIDKGESGPIIRDMSQTNADVARVPMGNPEVDKIDAQDRAYEMRRESEDWKKAVGKIIELYKHTANLGNPKEILDLEHAQNIRNLIIEKGIEPPAFDDLHKFAV